MIVVDASALVQAAIEPLTTGATVLDRLLTDESHCPHLVDAEVGQALRRFVLLGQWEAQAAELALHQAAQLVRVRHDIQGNLSAYAWGLRENVSFYDALYVALAVALDAPLLTADTRLARADLPCRVELVTG